MILMINLEIWGTLSFLKPIWAFYRLIILPVKGVSMCLKAVFKGSGVKETKHFTTLRGGRWKYRTSLRCYVGNTEMFWDEFGLS